MKKSKIVDVMKYYGTQNENRNMTIGTEVSNNYEILDENFK